MAVHVIAVVVVQKNRTAYPRHSNTFKSLLYACWHGGIMRWLSSMLTNMHCRFDPNQGWTSLCCLYVAVYGSLLRCFTKSIHIRMGELIVWIVFSTVAIRMYRSSPLVPLDSCLAAAACLSSACSFVVSQANDLTLLVGYVV